MKSTHTHTSINFGLMLSLANHTTITSILNWFEIIAQNYGFGVEENYRTRVNVISNRSYELSKEI
jgi:hypothetical protein